MEKNIGSTLKNNAKIKVFGVGGGGCNAVARMQNQIQGVELYVANTDNQALNRINLKNKVLIGEKLTQGLGCGANPEIGKKAAVESEDAIKNALANTDMLFIATGLGGGTGSGAAPVVAKCAKDMGILTVAVVTKPLLFEGATRKRNAAHAYDELVENVDSIIVVPNENVLKYYGNVPLNNAFAMADNVLAQAVQSITDLITMPANINLDFADVKATLMNKGKALFGIGKAKGSNRAKEAALEAINSPLLEASITGATSAIVNITAGEDLTLQEAQDVVQTINEQAGTEIDLIWGFATNDALNDECIVTIVATGLKEDLNEEEKFKMDKLRENNFAKQTMAQMSQQKSSIQPQQTSVYGQPQTQQYYAEEEPAQPIYIQKAKPRTYYDEEPSKESFLDRREKKRSFWG